MMPWVPGRLELNRHSFRVGKVGDGAVSSVGHGNKRRYGIFPLIFLRNGTRCPMLASNASSVLFTGFAQKWNMPMQTLVSWHTEYKYPVVVHWDLFLWCRNNKSRGPLTPLHPLSSSLGHSSILGLDIKPHYVANIASARFRHCCIAFGYFNHPSKRTSEEHKLPQHQDRPIGLLLHNIQGKCNRNSLQGAVG